MFFDFTLFDRKKNEGITFLLYMNGSVLNPEFGIIPDSVDYLHNGRVRAIAEVSDDLVTVEFIDPRKPDVAYTALIRGIPYDEVKKIIETIHFEE